MFTRILKVAIGLSLVAYPFFATANSYLGSALFIVMGILSIASGIGGQELPAGVSRVRTRKSKRDELLLSKDIMEQDSFSTDMDDSSIAPQRSREPFPRNRASRVMALSYKAAMGDGQQEIVLPFIMGVMGDFSGVAATKPGMDERVFLTIRENNFSAVLNQLKPRVKFEIEDPITGDHTMDVDLTFARLSDFFPEAVAAQLASKLPPVDATQEAGSLQKELTDWLSQYVKSGHDRAEPLAPLYDAGVAIVPHPDKPGFGLMRIELSGMYNVGAGPVWGEFNTEIRFVPPAPC